MRVGFGLGSNLGDKVENIHKALALLQQREIAKLEHISRVYRTPPWGVLDQGDFANACAIGDTRLSRYGTCADASLGAAFDRCRYILSW